MIAICESQFRAIKAVELGFEELFAYRFSTPSSPMKPGTLEWELAIKNLARQWRDFQDVCGSGWVLAAGSIPLSVGGRPPLVAPWVVGTITNRWLRTLGANTEELQHLVLDLVAGLLGQPVRWQEFRVWEELVDRITVSTGDGKQTLLTTYFAAPWERMVPSKRGHGGTVGSQWTPIDYIQTLPLDATACEAFAAILQKAWKGREKSLAPSSPQTITRRPHNVEDASGEFDNLLPSPCRLCGKAFTLRTVFAHLKAEHDIPQNRVKPVKHKNELRLVDPPQLLYKWENSPD